MAHAAGEPTPASTARLAGLAYLVIFITGIFAEFAVRSRLIVTGDAAATAANILAAERLYRASLASEFLMLVADVLLVGLLYALFKGVSRNLALLAACFRLVHAAIVGANLLNSYKPLLLLKGAAPAPELALRALEAQAFGYTIGLVFFGVHCLLLGALVWRAGFLPRVLGALLVVAGLGYLVDGFAQTLLANYADYEGVFEATVFGPAFVGELAFCLWLLIRGVRVPAPVTA